MEQKNSNKKVPTYSSDQTILKLKKQNEDLELALMTTIEHGDAVEEQLSLVNKQLQQEIRDREKVEQTLQDLVKQVQQQKSDLEIALMTAIEHGDAIQEEVYEINRQLNAEIVERNEVEAQLNSLVKNLHQQKDDLEVLVDTIASHGDEINTHIEKKMISMEAMAVIDFLTGLHNRRSYNDKLQYEWECCSRSQTYLSLLIIDIDNFKAYNDNYGHAQGDECIKKVAKVLAQSSKRKNDLIARYGGEEFAIILPDTSIEQAKTIAENIRQKVQQLAIIHQQNISDVVTISIGVASMIPDHNFDANILFEEADKQLYKAKDSGRNCVMHTSVQG